MNSNIKGEVRQIFYKSDSGFIAGMFKVKSTDDENLKKYVNKIITFSGSFHELSIDIDYIFYGSLVDHPKYGMQFKVDSYEQTMPEEKNSIISFLSSGLFPKVGIRTATKIVDVLGDKTLDLILDNYENLLMVPNMTEARAKTVYDILEKERLSYRAIVYLQEIGFSFNQSNKIYKFYKNETLKRIEENIYQIIESIDDIGFTTVDKIALFLDYKKDDERRIKACIIYSIYDICMNCGDTYTNLNDIYMRSSFELKMDINIDRIQNYLLILNKEGKIIIIKDKYFLRIFYDVELNIALKTIRLLRIGNTPIKNMDNYIDMLEKVFNIKYNTLQKKSIKMSLENNITIITGGPGTGKTTIIKAIVELYKEINKLSNDLLFKEIVLLAPTGRAAKRIKETTCFPSSTIHKFLKWNKETNEFSVNAENKSSVKFVIVDEASMIDSLLFKNLLDGLSDTIKIVIVGDHNQLPSVLPGQVLKDLIGSEIIPTIELNELYRQKDDSYIINLAHNIKEGNIEDDFLKKRYDYSFIECNKFEIERTIMELCKKAIEKNYSYKDVQILVPMYKGINGIDNLNNKLQNIFNPKDKFKNEFEYGDVIYREHDKVLQTKNVSDYDISNGDIGIIDYIGNEKDNYKILIDFDGELIEYTKSDFESVKLGYAISIHKSQGSEFDIVIIPMDMSFSRMLYRKLIYTAVTRAKKSLTLIGETEALKTSILNIKEDKRDTHLKDLIVSNI